MLQCDKTAAPWRNQGVAANRNQGLTQKHMRELQHTPNKEI